MRHDSEWRRKVSEANKKVIHTKEWNKKVSEGKKGISTKAWTYHTPKTPEHKRKLKESYQKTRKERYNNFYIVDGELYTGKHFYYMTNLKGKKLRDVFSELTPATQEEVEQYLKEHLLDTIFELECMKLQIK